MATSRREGIGREGRVNHGDSTRCFKCNTHVVATHDGYHIYFYVPKPMQFKGKLISGIDIKHKGYVVLPPSIHPSGTPYKIVNDVAPVDLPEDLMKLMTW